MGQGDSDPLIKPEWATKTVQELQKAGYKVSLKIYP
jgi:predicted esterase